MRENQGILGKIRWIVAMKEDNDLSDQTERQIVYKYLALAIP